MTVSSILFGTGLALLTVFFITRPFHQRSAPSAAGRRGQRGKLLAQKAAIYAAIREIDADAQLGKLEPADHRALRHRYLAEGVTALKALAALPAGDKIDAAIESALARLRKGKTARGGRFCPACGAPAGPGAQFCAQCGAQLES